MKINWIALVLLLSLLWVVAAPPFRNERPAAIDSEARAASSALPPQSPAAAHDERYAEQERTIRALTQQLAAFSSKLDAIEGTTQPTASADAVAKPKNSPPELTRAEYLAQLEQSFNAERADPLWARKTTDGIREAVQALPAFEKTVRVIECRAQRCRLELNRDDSEEFAQATLTFFENLAGTLPKTEYQYLDRGDGKRLLVLYMSGS